MKRQERIIQYIERELGVEVKYDAFKQYYSMTYEFIFDNPLNTFAFGWWVISTDSKFKEFYVRSGYYEMVFSVGNKTLEETVAYIKERMTMC